MKNIADQKFCTELSCWRKSYSTRLRCSYVQVIATQIIRSSSQSDWPLRNIYISKDNGSFTFYVDISFLNHCQYFYRTWLYIWITRRVSYKKLERLSLREHLSSSPFCCGFVWLIFFSFLYCPDLCLYSGVQQILCCVLFFFVLCSLCCQFLWIILFWLPLWYYLTFIPRWNLH